MNVITQVQGQSQKPVSKIDSTYVMNFLQVAYPDGFIKKYGRFLHSEDDKQQLVKSIRFMISDLSEDQLKNGMKRTRYAGFCPDIGLFVAWCMGLENFESPEDKIRKSYLSEDSALAHIINYNKKQSNFMTNAMQLAYEDTMQMFNDLEFSDNNAFLVHQTYKSFKCCYASHVNHLVSENIKQTVNDDLKALSNSEKTEKQVDKSKSISHRPYG
jgi:hypothetical protein